MSRCDHVVLWEKDVELMREGQSYKMVGATVHSICRNCVIQHLDDVGEISLGITCWLVNNTAQIWVDKISFAIAREALLNFLS